MSTPPLHCKDNQDILLNNCQQQSLENISPPISISGPESPHNSLEEYRQPSVTRNIPWWCLSQSSWSNKDYWVVKYWLIASVSTLLLFICLSFKQLIWAQGEVEVVATGLLVVSGLCHLSLTSSDCTGHCEVWRVVRWELKPISSRFSL